MQRREDLGGQRSQESVAASSSSLTSPYQQQQQQYEPAASASPQRQQRQSQRRPSSSSSSSNGRVFLQTGTSTDGLDRTSVEGWSPRQSTLTSLPDAFSDEHLRRPSAASYLSSSSNGKQWSTSSSSHSQSVYQTPNPSGPSSSNSHRKLSGSSSTSAPSTPRPRGSSRSKILASSAALVDGVVSPTLPYAYRTRSGSSDLSTPSENTSRSQYQAQNVNLRLPSSPPTHSTKKDILTAAAGGTSLAERKRRLASASGDASKFEQTEPVASPPAPSSASLSSRSLQNQDSQSNSSTSLPLSAAAKETADTHWKTILEDRAREVRAEDGKSISSRPSFRRRIFKLRRSQASNDNIPTLKGTDYADTEKGSTFKPPSSFSDSIDGVKMREAAAAATRTGSYRKNGVSDMQADDSPRRAPSTLAMETEDSSNSWITSLTSVSPPTMPDFARMPMELTSPISPAESRDDLDASSPEDGKNLQRTSSWPPNEQRKGSFVSVKGNGAGLGYRFENAASQVKTSPTEEKDPRRSPTLQLRGANEGGKSPKKGGRERSSKRDSMLEEQELQRLVEGRRGDLTAQVQRSNSTNSSLHASPIGNALDLHSVQASSPITMDKTDASSTRRKRRSNSYASSIHSVNSQTGSPISHTPRTSSLQGGRSPTTPARSTSARNSFMTAYSPSAIMEDTDTTLLGRVQEPMSKLEDRRRSNSHNKATGSAALPSNRSRYGSNFGEGSVAEEGSLQDFGTSPLSMETARQDLSPSQSILGMSTEDSLPLVVPLLGSEIGEEPKRPTKSPLRVMSTRSRQLSGREGSSLVAAAAVARERRIASSPMAIHANERVQHPQPSEEAAEDDGVAERSPPRKSLEDFAQMNGLFAPSSSQSSNLSSMTPLGARDSIERRSRMQPVPESAKKLGALTRGEEAYEGTSSGDKRTEEAEMIARESEEALPKDAVNKTLTGRYHSLRKVTPPALAEGFSKTKLSDRAAEEDSTKEGALPYVVAASSGLSATKTRRSKKWPFTKDKELALDPHESDSKESSSLGVAGKVGRTLRSKKGDVSPAQKPTITRVYGEALRNLSRGESDDSGDDMREPVPVQSGLDGRATLTPAASHRDPKSPLARLPSVSSLSMPSTPLPVDDEMTPEIKRLIRRRNVIRELVETERSYAADLVVVRDIYLARARAAVGLSRGTPLSGQMTPPLQSPDWGTAASQQASQGPGRLAVARNMRRVASSDLSLPPQSPLASAQTTTSPSVSSSGPSNRSSTYTISSQTSQTSDSSFPFQLGNAPPLPATPPSLAGLTTSAGSPMQSYSPSSNTSTSTFAASRPTSARPKVSSINTSGLFLNGVNSSPGATSHIVRSDPGLTVSDVRIIFAHLDVCCSFAEETASILAGSMGTFARSKKISLSDVQVDMDKGDDTLGEVFLNLMARIRTIYIDYCSRHETSIQRLQLVLMTSQKANLLFKECTDLARRYTNAWDLASLLIKPVQRVLKYPLLLQEIVICTPSSHPDYKYLQHALEDMQGVADEINQVKRRKDLADQLITGRIRDAKVTVMTPGGSSRSKKRLDARAREEENLASSVLGDEAALERYTSMLKMFNTLSEQVQTFAQQSMRWSVCLRESYISQVNVISAFRRVYLLQPVGESADSVAKSKENARHKGETAVVKAYRRLLLKMIETSWQQTDDEIRSVVLAMTTQISKHFESPRLVMMKRDERQADYVKFRQWTQSGRQVDRKSMENALGFIALNAQLVEDLPLFLVGMQTLLDVTIHTFARIQAAHFDQVRALCLNFWREEAKRGQEIVTAADGSGLPSLRQVNLVKAFWDRHSVSAAWMDSLGIVHPKRSRANKSGDVMDSDAVDSMPSSAVSTPGLMEVTQVLPVEGARVTSGSSRENNTSDEYILPLPSISRAKSDTTRSASTNTCRDEEDGKGGESRGTSLAESGPRGGGDGQPAPLSLTYREDETGQGYFVQMRPIAFLDSGMIEGKRTIGSTDTLISGDQLKSLTRLPGPETSQSFSVIAQRMDVVEEREAQVDSFLSPFDERLGHHEWPFVHFLAGDTLQVLLQTNEVSSEPLFFGRVKRSGHIGWAYTRAFARASPISESAGS